MKFAVAGAGAIGAFVGAQLARSGQEVALLARGPHVQAIRQNGLTVRLQRGEYTVRPFATDSAAEIGPVDVILLTVKAQSLQVIAPKLAPLLGPDTAVVPGQNGIPWWYFQKHGGPFEGQHLESVDPGGVLTRTLNPERIIGWVVYCSTEIVEPGVIRQVEGDRFSIGELDGTVTGRCRDVSQAFRKAGLRCPVRSRIRHDIWVKLIGNLAFNPISALTRATMDKLLQNPETRRLIREVMQEGTSVAAALGVPLDISVDERMAGAARVGAHKTSMLQDLEAGRPLELEPIVGAVLELADKAGVPVPHVRTLYACTKMLVAGVRS